MSNDVSAELPAAVREIQTIGSVAQILQTVAAITGLGFVAVAHVTDHSWTTCAVLDRLNFGLKIGDGLDVSTTLCDEVRASGYNIVIDDVCKSDRYRDHPTPRIFAFQSYFSIPIFRPDGAYFGTLCGLDPHPSPLSNPATVSTLELFAQLISKQLEVEQAHAVTEGELLAERETSELREQFIAVLGHDLRTPLSAIQSGVELLRLVYTDQKAIPILQRMQRSAGRMSALIDDVVDFTRGRMGGGIALNMRHEKALETALVQVIDELRELHSAVTIVARIEPVTNLFCDSARLSQLLSNLLKNAIVHGDDTGPVSVTINSKDGRFNMIVTNQGKSLAPELTAQLFKPFWRAPTKGEHQGLGLGLYIVSEIARSHGGNMTVASRDGEVSFRFSMVNNSGTPALPLS